MNDKRQALLFSALVLLVSWSYEAYVASHGGVARFGVAGLLVLMCIPGLLSVVIRLILKVGFADVGFILGDRKYYAYALSIPLTLALMTGLMGAISDARQFALIAPGGLVETISILFSMIAIGFVGAFGEELGWRGFLLPKVVSARISHPYLAVGFVWACWHLPLIAFGGFYETDYVLIMVLVYCISILAINSVICELRTRSRSVWVAAVLHAAHNFFFQLAVPALLFSKPGARAKLWEVLGGDSGVTVAVLYGLTFLVMNRFHKPNRLRTRGA